MSLRRQSPAKIVAVFLLSLVAVLVILSLPLVEQTQIHVAFSSNYVSYAWVGTSRVSLLSTVITPAPEIGIYSVSINITETGETFAINNVQPDEYIIIWRQGLLNATPESGTYNIQIELFRDSILIDAYSFQATF